MILKLSFNDFMSQLRIAKRTGRPTLHYEETPNKFTMYFNYLGEWKYSCEVKKKTIADFGDLYSVEREEAINDWKMEYLSDALELDALELDIEEPMNITNKEAELEPGEDVIDESKDYKDFYVETVKRWKAKTLKALEEIPIEKKFDTEVSKEFGAFLSKLMNGINSAVFLKVIRRFIKKGMIAGMESVEEETEQQIGFTFSMNERLKALEGQEINGYKLPDGKVWPGIKGATKKLQFKILKSVEESVKNKENRKEMTEKIEKIFDGSSKAQAERIARTETTRFINEGKLASYQEIGMKYKSWDAVLDQRTSDIDRRLHNKYQDNPIPIDEMFIDEVTGKTFMYPPSHPNCRCVISGKMKKS